MNIAFDKGHLGGQNGVLRMIRDFCTSICDVMRSTRDKNSETTWEMEYMRDSFLKSFVLYTVKTVRKRTQINIEINGQNRVIINRSSRL